MWNTKKKHIDIWMVPVWMEKVLHGQNDAWNPWNIFKNGIKLPVFKRSRISQPFTACPANVYLPWLFQLKPSLWRGHHWPGSRRHGPFRSGVGIWKNKVTYGLNKGDIWINIYIYIRVYYIMCIYIYIHIRVYYILYIYIHRLNGSKSKHCLRRYFIL